VAPDVSERHEAASLARAERRARHLRGFTLSPLGNGQVRLHGLLDTEAAATVTAAIDPLSRPRPDDPRTAAQRRADALLDVCQRVLVDSELPDSGGDRPQVVVTMSYDALYDDLKTACLDNGERLTAEQARRIACDAQIVPAVLGGAGQVLDVGASRRTISGPLRRAVVLRDGGCAFPGCDRPARWCQAHHVVHWADDGPSTLDNAVLLCSYHHRSVHHHGWEVRLGADRRPEFIPPPHIDPHRRPRRNPYHHRE